MSHSGETLEPKPSGAPWTPAPWRLDDPIHGRLIHDDHHFVDAGCGYCAGSRGEHGFSISGIMSLENARLIAAAPELANALALIANVAAQHGKSLRDLLPPNERMEFVHDKAVSALKLAREGR